MDQCLSVQKTLAEPQISILTIHIRSATPDDLMPLASVGTHTHTRVYIAIQRHKMKCKSKC